jgi:hypothetical protein
MAKKVASPRAPSERTVVQRELDEMIQDCHRSRNLGRGRRILAYCLKFVAGGSALAITFGKWPASNQILGFAALVAIFLDAITSNHLRLIGEARAGHAFNRIGSTLVKDHNRALTALMLELRDAQDDAARRSVSQRISDLEATTHATMSARMTEIRDALAELDLKALQSLSLEPEAGGRGGQTGKAG